MFRVSPPKHIPRVFQDGMLKPAASTEEGDEVFAGVANGEECATHMTIRARWNAPKTVKGCDALDRNHLLSGHPLKANGNPQFLGGSC